MFHQQTAKAAMSEPDERRATRYGFQTGRPTLTLQACASPNTPDVHSVIGRPPDASKGVRAAGFPAHGIQRASVPGRSLG
jgi:hypothetical protein